MHIRHPEWRAEHEPTKFPFGQDCSLVNEAGDVIFETTFLDATFYVSGAQAGLYLSRVSVDVDNVTLWVGDPSIAQLAYGTFPRAEPPAELRFLDNYGRPAGLIVSESIRMSLFSSWPIGDHDFLANQTQFVARCCHALPMVGVRGFELDDGSILTGDVWLVGDDGVILSCDTVDEAGACGEETAATTQLRVDVVGDSLFRRRLCSAPDFFETPHYLQTVTFCAPGLLESYSSTMSSYTYDSSFISECPSISSTPPDVLPLVDVLILVDTTLPMAPFIARLTTDYIPYVTDLVATNSLGVLDSHDVEWAVADYKDYTDGAPFDDLGFRVIQPFTSNHTTAMAALASLTCSGGGDHQQEQLKTIRDLGDNWETSGLNGRPGSHKIVIWAMCNPGHLNFPGSITELLPYASFYPTGTYNSDYTEIRAEVDANSIQFIPINPRSEYFPTNGVEPLTEDQEDMLSACSQAYLSTGSNCVWFADFYRNTAQGNFWYRVNAITGSGEGESPPDCTPIIDSVPIDVKVPIVNYYPPTETGCVRCGPGEFGDIKIFVHSQSAPDTVLRIRPVSEGLKIETIGEAIEKKSNA